MDRDEDELLLAALMRPGDYSVRYLGGAGPHLIEEPVVENWYRFASQPSKNDPSKIIKKAESPQTEISSENMKDATTSPTPMESIEVPVVDDTESRLHYKSSSEPGSTLKLMAPPAATDPSENILSVPMAPLKDISDPRLDPETNMNPSPDDGSGTD